MKLEDGLWAKVKEKALILDLSLIYIINWQEEMDIGL
jgi:hypothetical protein